MAVADFIVDTGDDAVLLPIALLIFVALRLTGALRESIAWALAIGSCGGSILVLKLVFYACAPSLVAAGLRSPSGHTALATAVYGALAAIVLAGVNRTEIKAAVILVVVAWIAAIAVSSVAIHAHSIPEVAVGVVAGAASIWLFRVRGGSAAALKGHLAVPLILAVAALVLLHGQRVEAEGAIERMAALIDHSTGCAAPR